MVRTSLGSISLALTALSLAGCGSLGPATHHARLADGAGIAAQSPVLVAGVRVGQVQSIQVVDGVVDVAERGHADAGQAHAPASQLEPLEELPRRAVDRAGVAHRLG